MALENLLHRKAKEINALMESKGFLQTNIIDNALGHIIEYTNVFNGESILIVYSKSWRVTNIA